MSSGTGASTAHVFRCCVEWDGSRWDATPAGRLKIHWNLKVSGHRLRQGTYQIILRALDRHRTVLSTTNPVTLRIKH